jgi:anti-sigma regulatory factor (Ser/Thr protein kinase)
MTCYGGGFACVPAYIGDLFGTKHLATIHGAILTAWAAAGLSGPLFAAWIREQTGSYSQALFFSLILFAPAFAISMAIHFRLPKPSTAPEGFSDKGPEEFAQPDERMFAAHLELLPQVMDFVTAHSSKAGLSQEKPYKIKVAVEEAVVNICHYAYLEEAAVNLINCPYRSPGLFLIRAKQENSDFLVEIVDQGLAFNPLSVAPPERKERIEDQSFQGIGIHLIRRLTDEVHYWPPFHTRSFRSSNSRSMKPAL